MGEWNEHLVEFHRALADATSQPLLQLRTSDGRTSYEALTDEVFIQAPGAQSILDLGCGDGVLLQHLQVRYPTATLVGVDLSDAEVERAARRLPNAKFYCAPIHEFDSGERFDAIVAHLVLGIVPQLPQALAHVHTLLKPNGKLIFAIEDNLNDAAPARFLKECILTVRETYPEFTALIPERLSNDDDDVLFAVLAAAGFRKTRISRRYCVEAMVEAQAAWEFLYRAYPIGLLAHDILTPVRNRFIAHAQSIANNDGCVRVDYPIKVVVSEA